MGKLPIVTARKLIKVLENLGFEIIRQKGSHVRLKTLMVELLPYRFIQARILGGVCYAKCSEM